MITRNTIRPDGLTVGEALDKDAEFIRRVAPMPVRTHDEILEGYRDTVRAAVLDALDETAKEITGNANDGPKDKELPAIFAGLDPVIERIFNKSLGL